jgi:hypothetical protein
MRHESLMAAAQQVEARLPLEVRLGLDIMPDGNPLLPSQRVRRPGAASMLSPIPWPALFGATIPSVSAFDAATRLSADNLHVESDVSGKYRACARVNNQWSNQWLELQALSDLPQLVQTLDTAIGESEYKATTLTPPDEEKGCFRATSHRVNSPGRFRHVLRPIVFEPASLTDRS